MALKLILMLLTTSCVVQLYSSCPHRDFVTKHVCRDCSSGNLIQTTNNVRKFATKIESTVMRFSLPTVQTVYTTDRTNPRDWIDGSNRCNSRSNINKYRCVKKWRCRQVGDSKARHCKSNRCPNIDLVNLCTNCQNVDANKQTAAVEQYAYNKEKDKYNEIKRKGKQYTAISAQTVYIVYNVKETLGTFWHSPSDCRQSCEMIDSRPKYDCASSWDCSPRGTGLGTHDRNNGHLTEK